MIYSHNINLEDNLILRTLTPVHGIKRLDTMTSERQLFLISR